MSGTLAYIGLGANLGDARATLLDAVSELDRSAGMSRPRVSRLYRSAPVHASGPDFLNAVAAVRTDLDPERLLRRLLEIEQHHGRLRPYRNAPRTLDLDLLLYGDRTLALPHLIVPHPRLHERAFVLRPLQDLDPDLVLPAGRLEDLLDACRDQALEVLAGPEWWPGDPNTG